MPKIARIYASTSARTHQTVGGDVGPFALVGCLPAAPDQLCRFLAIGRFYFPKWRVGSICLRTLQGCDPIL